MRARSFVQRAPERAEGFGKRMRFKRKRFEKESYGRLARVHPSSLPDKIESDRDEKTKKLQKKTEPPEITPVLTRNTAATMRKTRALTKEPIGFCWRLDIFL